MMTPRSSRPRIVLTALAALMIAALACARGDIEVTEMRVPSATPLPASPSASPVPASPTEAPTLAPTATPTPSEPEAPASPTPPPTPTAGGAEEPETIVYEAQPGDTLRSVAVRFAVVPEEISSAQGAAPRAEGLLDPATLLLIPRRLGPTGPDVKLIPDSEFVYSPHAVEFDAVGFAAERQGFLNEYEEYVYGAWRSGPEIVELAARDNSVNPRLLLAMLEYEAGWVTDPTRPRGDAFRYPLGYVNPEEPGLFRQLTWLANKMGEGYYGWRAGTLTELSFRDGTGVRLAPGLNAGTVALQYYFAQTAAPRDWARAVSPEGLLQVYESFFGDPWQYEHPLLEAGISQPRLTLPFLPGRTWAFTGGPHGAWEREAAWAALDFAPPSVEGGCAESTEWVVAAAPGLVVRSGGGVVVLDLDGDGREQTGWALLYLHISTDGRAEVGEFVEEGDLLGHPSCEGGLSTGTHVHIARKYNGEWILADGPIPFELSGWIARAGSRPYLGALVNGDRTILACTCASSETYISRAE